MRSLASPSELRPTTPRPAPRPPGRSARVASRATGLLPALLALVLLLGSGLPAFAESSGTISGRVFRDDNGNGSREDDEPGLTGVLVHLTGKAGTRNTETDDQGAYHFQAVPAGSYSLTVDPPDAYARVADDQHPDGVWPLEVHRGTDEQGPLFALRPADTAQPHAATPAAGADGTATPAGQAEAATTPTAQAGPTAPTAQAATAPTATPAAATTPAAETAQQAATEQATPQPTASPSPAPPQAAQPGASQPPGTPATVAPTSAAPAAGTASPAPVAATPGPAAAHQQAQPTTGGTPAAAAPATAPTGEPAPASATAAADQPAQAPTGSATPAASPAVAAGQPSGRERPVSPWAAALPPPSATATPGGDRTAQDGQTQLPPPQVAAAALQEIRDGQPADGDAATATPAPTDGVAAAEANGERAAQQFNNLRSAPREDGPQPLNVFQNQDTLWLGVPFRTQIDDSAFQMVNCGPASLSMVLGAFGLNVVPSDIRAYVNYLSHDYNTDNGTSLDTLAAIAQIVGLKPVDLYTSQGYRQWTVDMVRDKLAHGQPVITLVKYRSLPGHANSISETDHYIVIAGLYRGDFIYNDAAYATEVGYGLLISPQQLEQAWAAASLQGHAVAFANGQGDLHFDLPPQVLGAGGPTDADAAAPIATTPDHPVVQQGPSQPAPLAAPAPAADLSPAEARQARADRALDAAARRVITRRHQIGQAAPAAVPAPPAAPAPPPVDPLAKPTVPSFIMALQQPGALLTAPALLLLLVLLALGRAAWTEARLARRALDGLADLPRPGLGWVPWLLFDPRFLRPRPSPPPDPPPLLENPVPACVAPFAQ